MDFAALLMEVVKQDVEGKAVTEKSLARYQTDKVKYNELLKQHYKAIEIEDIETAKQTQRELSSILNRIGNYNATEALDGFSETTPTRAEIINHENMKEASARIKEIEAEIWQPKRIDVHRKEGKVAAAVVIFERPYIFQFSEIVDE